MARLFLSQRGGKTIYHTADGTNFMLYYAHLDDYADDLREGQTVEQGDVIGYVGTTGNAPPDVPRLHFAIHELEPDRHWWRGTPINPYPYLTGAMTLPLLDDEANP